MFLWRNGGRRFRSEQISRMNGWALSVHGLVRPALIPVLRTTAASLPGNFASLPQTVSGVAQMIWRWPSTAVWPLMRCPLKWRCMQRAGDLAREKRARRSAVAELLHNEKWPNGCPSRGECASSKSLSGAWGRKRVGMRQSIATRIATYWALPSEPGAASKPPGNKA